MIQAVSWPQSDDALVELARTDPEAFGELYQRHVKRVYNYIYYRVGACTQDAEDLTARTFLQALSHLPRFRQQGAPISAWLLRIAHNLVANWHRDRKHNLSLPDTLESRDDSNHPTVVSEKKEERAELLRAVAALPAERQQLLILRFVEEMRASDIAVVMGRSEGAVKALLHRTMTHLRTTMSAASASSNDAGKGMRNS